MDATQDEYLDLDTAASYKSQPDKYWHLFYQRNAERFFRDRHWLEAEFPQLFTATTALELGCGAGNTVFPLLELVPTIQVYACDFAPSAIELVKNHPSYTLLHAAGRCTAFIADIANDDLTETVPSGSIDVCTMIYVLSALEPGSMLKALVNISKTLKSGSGRILFRDYAAGDLAEKRFAAEGKQRKVEDNFYARWDGTFAYYFSEDYTRQIFAQAGFRCDSIHINERQTVNHKRGINTDRRFVQAVFNFTGEIPPEIPSSLGNNKNNHNPSNISASLESTVPCRDTKLLETSGSSVDLYRETTIELLSPRFLLKLRVPCSMPDIENTVELKLARVLLDSPELVRNKTVLHLGCGCRALASFAALRWARRVIAADSLNNSLMTLLKHNVTVNGCQVVIERLRLLRLRDLSPQEAVPSLRRCETQGFDVVVANVLELLGSGADTSALNEVLSTVAGVLRLKPGSAIGIIVGGGGAVTSSSFEHHGLRQVSVPVELSSCASDIVCVGV